MQMSDIVIENNFDESSYEGYETTNLIEYTEIMGRLKAEISLQIFQNYTEEQMKIVLGGEYAGSIRGVWEDGFDYCYYRLFTRSTFDKEYKITGSEIVLDIVEMQIGASENACLETENVFCEPEQLHFSQY